MKASTQTTISVFVSICVLFSMCFAGLNYLASAKDLERVEQRLDLKITSDAILQISQRIWSLEDRHREEGKDPAGWDSSYEDATEYRNLKIQLENLKLKQIDLMQRE